MDNQIKRLQVTNIMNTMDQCLAEIKYSLDKLQFEQVTSLMTVLVEAFVAVNEFVESDFHDEIQKLRQPLEMNRISVNEALESVLATYDSHDMELRVGSYESLQQSLFNWTGNLFDALKLYQ